MPLIVEIETGPLSGRKIVLRAGQSVAVGRSEEADLAVPTDLQMSRRHFQVACTTAQSLVRDLRSTNGTFLNGERIAEATLRDGDRVRAGNTTFLIQIPVSTYVGPSAAIPLPTAVAPLAENSPGDAGRESRELVSTPGRGSAASEAVLPVAEAEDQSDSSTTGGKRDERAATASVSAPDQARAQRRTVETIRLARIRDFGSPLPVLSGQPREFGQDPRSLQSVILEIVSKDQRRRHWQLRSGQTATVGSGADADFVVGADPAMSSVHFELATDVNSCRIRDRQSRTGTFVNDLPVRSAVLYHQDRIRAGQTEFCVSILGGRPAPAEARDRRGDEFVLDVRPDPKCRPVCFAERCRSGVTVFRSVGADPAPARVIRLLARAAPLYAIVDFGRLALPLPAELMDRSLIFDCLPAEFASESSPLLVADVEVRELGALIEAGWGKNAVVCFLSRDSKAKVLERLRELTRIALPTAEKAPDGAALGICWPALLELLLRHTPPDNVGQLLSASEAYFLEAQPPSAWQIMAQESFSATLAQLGFVPPPTDVEKMTTRA